MTNWPSVSCPSAGCVHNQKPILLPASIQRYIVPPLEHAPKDKYRIYVACPLCKLVSLYCRIDRHPVDQSYLSDFRNRRAWIRVLPKYEQGHSDIPSEFLVLMGEAEKKALNIAMCALLRSGEWTWHPTRQSAMQPITSLDFSVEPIPWD